MQTLLNALKINESMKQAKKCNLLIFFSVCAFHFRVFIVEHFGLGCCNMQCNEMHMINWILRNLVSSMILVHSIFCCCCWESALRILCIFNVLVVSFGLYSSLFYVTVALQYVYVCVCARAFFVGSFHANTRSADSLILLVLIRISN